MRCLSVWIAGITLAACLAFAPAGQTQAQGAFSTDEREEIGEIIRDYLLANPQLLEEVFEALETQQADRQASAQRDAVAENADALFRTPDAYVAGNPDGDVTVVEFFDYNCGYCKRMMPDLLALMEADPDVRLVLKEWPILGPPSVEAARVAVAVRNTAPERYFDFHVALMEESGRIGMDEALGVAEDMGLDRDAIAAAADEPDVEATLRETLRLGNSLELRGTPTYVVDDEVMMGAVGLDTLREGIERVRDTGCRLC